MTDDEFAPHIVYLLGSPGVGKYTVGRALAARSGAVVVDNQLINHPVLALFAWDGRSDLLSAIWGPIGRIRAEVLTVMKHLTPTSISYVLTNALENDAAGHAVFSRIRDLAATRGAEFVPVMLTCDLDEQCRRVTSPQRRQRLKLSDPDQLREYLASTAMYLPDDPRLLTLDTTDLSPEHTAGAILDHVRIVR
ncbi:hypothetical protein AB0M43_15305 [Longispora sp. NPDC051575]|uniref:AAA family ATPase n=1 Tax=Longispora sp. NPDC051575 TaxID=3154943 RepID=UPI0034433960